MFTKVHKPLKLAGGNNKGSSFNLMEYLSKENENLEKTDAEYEPFFNQYRDDFSETKAVQVIDGNNNRLSDKDTKFYMLSINPSWEEQQHLISLSSGGRTIEKEELKLDEKVQYHNYLKEYTKDVMSLYTNSFMRKDEDGNQIKLDANDLNYVAKIEQKRNYKIWDKPVKHNLKIRGRIDKLNDKNNKSMNPLKIKSNNKKIKELEGKYLRDNNGIIQNKEGKVIRQGVEKGGWNNHVHVVVSRQTKSKWYKGIKVVDEKGNVLDKTNENKARGLLLSPNATGIGKSENHKLNDQKVHVGFHHEKFKSDSSTLFNEKFNYKPKEKEQYKGDSYKETSDSSKTLINKLASKPLGKLKSTVKEKIKGEAFQTEEKIIRAVTNPKGALLSELKNKVKKILLAQGLEK